MKIVIVVIIAVLLFPGLCVSQSMTVQTDQLHMALGNGSLPNTVQLPTINWIYPSVEFTSSEASQVEIICSVNSHYPLKSVTIKLMDRSNGVVASSKDFRLDENSKEFLVKQKVFMTSGSNVVEITVTDSHGASVSSHRNISAGMANMANVLAIDRKDYALIIATDKYEHYEDLVNPIDDGHAIGKELKERYGFNVEILENPTLEAIWEKLRDYNEREFKPQDQLFILIAAHGQFDEAFGEGYVVAKNSLRNDPSRNSYLSHNRLRAVVNNIPNQHILLTMDVCYGGSFDPVLARSRSGTDEHSATTSEFVSRKLSSKTRKYLTSGGKEYVSDGVPGKHSPFAAKLLESLQTNGGEDRILTISELQSNLEKLKVLPRYGSFGDDTQRGEFVFIAKQGH